MKFPGLPFSDRMGRLLFWRSCPRLVAGGALVRRVVILISLMLPQIAWAQEEGEETQARWLLAYCLVALLIGLSAYSICRPSRRRKKSE